LQLDEWSGAYTAGAASWQVPKRQPIEQIRACRRRDQ
jgi:hypothetical protein